jgi:hypothetical protein
MLVSQLVQCVFVLFSVFVLVLLVRCVFVLFLLLSKLIFTLFGIGRCGFCSLGEKFCALKCGVLLFHCRQTPTMRWKYILIHIVPRPILGHAHTDPSISTELSGAQLLPKAFLRSTDAQVLRQTLMPFSTQVSETWIWKLSPSEQHLFVPTNKGWDFYKESAGRCKFVFC